MRIEVTHIGEDYAKVEIQESKTSSTMEYEVSKEIASFVRDNLRGMRRIVTSQASTVIEIKND